MSDIRITTLTPNDWQHFKDIRLEALAEEPQAFSTTYTDALKLPDDYWKDKLQHKDQLILFVKDSEKVIGIVNVHLKHENVNTDTAIITSVYLNKAYRGKGIGKQMFLEVFKQLALYPHIKTANLWVLESQTRSIAFYKSVGFRQVGKKEDALETENGYIDELIMEKTV